MKNHKPKTLATGITGALLLSLSAQAATWTGLGVDSEYSTAANWDDNLVPAANSTQDINNGDTVERTVNSIAGRTFVDGGSTLNVTTGTHNDNRSGAGIWNFVGGSGGTEGTVNVSGGQYSIGHSIRIGSGNNNTGTVSVTGGALIAYRGSNSLIDPANPGGRPSMEVGGAALTTGNSGLFEISGGSFATRGGVHIGENGTFSVVGSGASSIGIGSEQSADGTWLQIANSTLKASVDSGGVTKIFIDDVEVDGSVQAEFRSGSLLDVGFVGAPVSGTWTVLELENADIVDGGLAFAPGVDLGVWSFNIDNTGVNGLLTVTAVAPAPFVWDGNLSDNWDLATANWQGGLTFSDPGVAVFDDTLSGGGTVDLMETFTTVNVEVNNSSTNYTFTGAGQLSGVSGLTKDGTGSLALNNTGGNDFTGPLQINDGTVTLGDAAALGGTGAPLDMNGGTLDLGTFSVTKGTTDISGGSINNGTLTSPLSGGAGTVNAVLAGATTTVTKTGSGTLLLGGASTYEGLTSINEGILQLGNDLGLGASETSTSNVPVSNVRTVDALIGDLVLYLSDTSGLMINDTATGTGIPVGAVITAIDADSNVTLDMAPTVTDTMLSVTFERVEVVETIVGPTTIASGATLDLNGQSTAEIITVLSGTGVGGNGAIINSNVGTPGEITTDIHDVGVFTVGGAGDLILPNVTEPAGVTRGITKKGAGTLTLGGDLSNNRIGLTVDEGNVKLSKDSGFALGRFPLVVNNAASTVTLEGPDQIHNNQDANGTMQVNEGTLDLAGFDEDFARLGTTGDAGPGGTVTNNNGGMTSTLTLLGGTIDAIWPGDITGNLNLIKEGSNGQVLAGSSTYTGTTTVSEGGLIIGTPGSIPASGAGVTVAAAAGFGFDPAGFLDAEIETIVNNVSWDATSGLVFTVNAPDTEVVSADLSLFGGSTIVLSGDGTLDLTGATLPAGLLFETPDGGTIIGGASPDIMIDSITVGPGSVSGKKVTLSFTASGNVDAYASDSMQPGTWSLVSSAVSSSPAEVEDNVASTTRFYFLVPEGNGNPFP